MLANQLLRPNTNIHNFNEIATTKDPIEVNKLKTMTRPNLSAKYPTTNEPNATEIVTIVDNAPTHQEGQSGISKLLKQFLYLPKGWHQDMKQYLH